VAGVRPHLGDFERAVSPSKISEQKLENMTNERFGKASWRIDEFKKPRRKREDVTTQRGPAYTPREADKLIREIARMDKRSADVLNFIRATAAGRRQSLDAS